MTEGGKIRMLVQQCHWSNTFRLDCTALGEPIGPVSRQYSCEDCLGRPMEQPKPGTCALVASTVCVDAVHRKHHGVGCRALEPDGLIQACHEDGIWKQGQGAYVGGVLDKIREMGGVPATTNASTPAPCVLPLRSWQKHRWAAAAAATDGDGGLSPKHVAALLDSHGPCIGVLWACPWYQLFDADRDETLVYRGCGRSKDARDLSKQLYRDKAGSHAVVCFGYRFCGDQMHVLVLDNHSATGPRRWIDVEELDTLYTLTVDPCSCI